MNNDNTSTPNSIKYSIWDTRSDEHQPAVEKILKNHQKNLNQKHNKA